MYMDINSILTALKFNELPTQYLTDSLFNAAKVCEPVTQKTFFSSESPDNNLKYAEVFRNEIKEFSARLICHAISKNHDYNFSICVVPCDNNILTDWFEINSAKVGRAFMFNLISERLGGSLESLTNQLKDLSDTLIQESYIKGLFFESTSSSSALTGKITLSVLKLLDKDEIYLNTVIKEWSKHPLYSKIFADYDTYKWLDSVSEHFLSTGGIFEDIKENVKKACSKLTNSVRTKKDVLDITPSGAPIYGNVNQSYDVYGESVVNWMNQVATKYNLKSSKVPKNEFIRTKINNESGCVLSSTQILMADGSSKKIEEIKAGDLVFSIGGNVSITSDEIIVNSHVHEFYSVNEDEPFMSLEHAVLTQSGWKCMNPEVAKALNPDIDISLLQEGDVICKVKGYDPLTETIEYKNVEVKRINIEEKKDVISYDLHFSDGYKSYHANQYCCMLNYPAITAKSIKKNLLGIKDTKEIAVLKEKIENMTPELNKMFGSSSVEYVKGMLDRPTIQIKPGTNKLITKHWGERSFIFNRLDFDDKKCDIESISIIKGNIFAGHLDSSIDGFADEVRFFSEEGALYFAKDDSRYYLKLLHDGLMAKGAVLKNGKIRTFTALSEMVYTLYYQKNEETPTFLAYFKTWFEKDEQGNYYPASGLFLTEDTSDEPICSGRFRKETVGNLNVLAVELLVDHQQYQIFQDYGYFFFNRFDLSFSMDYSSLNGIAQRPDDDTKYKITGTYKDSIKLQRIENSIVPFLMKKRPKAESIYSASDVRASEEMKLLKNTDALNVNDLFCISQPEDIKVIHDLNFNKIKDMMLYVIPQDWRDLIKQPIPSVGEYGDLTEEERDRAVNDPEINKFLIENFGKGYFTTALSQSMEQPIVDKFKRFNRYEEKLDYYWKGIDKASCFSGNPTYSKLTNASYLNSYLEFVPRLRDYKKDNPKKWARELYQYVTADRILFMLAFETSTTDKSKLHHIVTMLDILDNGLNVDVPAVDDRQVKTSYANALYYKVMSYSLAYECKDVFALSEGMFTETEMTQVIENYFREYYLSLINGTDFCGMNWNEELQKELLRELEEYTKEFEIKNVNAYINHISSFITDFSIILVRSKNLEIAKLQQISKNYPRITKSFSWVIEAIYYGAFALSIFKVVSSFDHIKPAEWVQIAISNINVVARGFNSFAVWKAGKVALNPQSSMPEMINAAKNLGNAANKIDIIEIGAKEVGDTKEFITTVGENAGKNLADEAGGGVAKLTNRWSKIARVSGVIVKVVTVIALAAATAFAIYQTVLDFQNGESVAIKTLQIIQTVSTGIVFLIEAGSGIAALAGVTVCSAIPIVGVAIMVIGLIVSIVLMFLPRKKEPTKAERFVDEHCKDFLNSLPLPDEAWLKSQKNMDDHLNSAKALPCASFA